MLRKRSAIVLRIVVGCILFAGLPVAGWGVADIRGFLDNPARAAFLGAVAVLQILSIGIVLLGPFSGRHGVAAFDPFQAGGWIGAAVFAGGFIPMNASRAALGRTFRIRITLREDHRLVTDGVFARIRNPRHPGIILNNVGLACSSGRPRRFCCASF
jgi:protein-S-isoprenylcysteine O-methyltransferase Ste14